MKTSRFQNRVITSPFALPAAILLSVACWLCTAAFLPALHGKVESCFLWDFIGGPHLPGWADRLSAFLLYIVVGYILIDLNNTYALIRTRASIQTGIYFLLVSICPALHVLSAGTVASVLFMPALFFLFRSYQHPYPAADVFLSSAFIGAGSLFLPQLTLLLPVFWIGTYNFRSLTPRSFPASLLGWFLPYWFLLGHCYFYGDMETFYRPFRELTAFQPVDFGLQPDEAVTLGFLFVLFAVSAGHAVATGYEDKIRTRSYLNFLTLTNLCLFVLALLQPSLCTDLLPFLMVGTAVLAGHLFVLSNTRSSNVFFICIFIGLFLLLGWNVWMLLLTH